MGLGVLAPGEEREGPNTQHSTTEDRALLRHTTNRQGTAWRVATATTRPTSSRWTLDAAAVVAEEAVERKDARRVKPWLSELDVPEWQELAGDRLWGGGRCMLKSTKVRTHVCCRFTARRHVAADRPRGQAKRKGSSGDGLRACTWRA